MLPDEVLSVSEFISIFNQTLDYAFPNVVIEGEIANIRVSKNKWLYFDLKDDSSCLKFFGTVFNMHSPLEDGMTAKVTCYPRLHNLYGLSMQVQVIELTGEGSIKRSALMLERKLRKEGLFDIAKKRVLPYPPQKIGLITSSQSAAYADFVKIINSRWSGIEVDLFDVQVQGELAIEEIPIAIEYFNVHAKEYDALVVIRGGGSPEDLAAFSSEAVTRAVSSSIVPTLVAIGHEIDVSLAELAADARASTPSNAAETLVPDKKALITQLKKTRNGLAIMADDILKEFKNNLKTQLEGLISGVIRQLDEKKNKIETFRQILNAYNPEAVLARGYSIVRKNNKVIYTSKVLAVGDILGVQFSQGTASSQVKEVGK